MKINKEDKKFNRGVFIGLVGGLFVFWAQLASEEMINILNIPNNYIFKMFASLFIAIFLFLIFSITHTFFRKK